MLLTDSIPADLPGKCVAAVSLKAKSHLCAGHVRQGSGADVVGTLEAVLHGLLRALQVWLLLSCHSSNLDVPACLFSFGL